MAVINARNITTGLDNYLGRLDTALATQVFQGNLPLVGNALKNSSISQFLTRARSRLQLDYNSEDTIASDALQQVLYDIFGSDNRGLGLLQDLNGDGVTNISDIQVNDRTYSTGYDSVYYGADGYAGTVDFKFKLGQAASRQTVSLARDLGLPRLGFKLDGSADFQAGYSFVVNFGVALDGTSRRTNDQFYIETSDPNEFSIAVSASNPQANGKLGFLEVAASDRGTRLNGSFAIDLKDSNDAGTQLTTAELNSIGSAGQDLIDARFSGNAAVKLNLRTSFKNGARFPSLSTDFALDWAFSNSRFNPNSPSGFGSAPRVAFTNVQLDMGTFLRDFASPILGEIQKVTKPLQPVVNVLQRRLPVISDLAKRTVTLVELAETAARIYGYKFDSRFIKAAAGITTLVNSLPKSSALVLDLGSFDFGAVDVREANFNSNAVNPVITRLTNPSQQLNADAALASFMRQTQDRNSVGQLAFPILTNPTAAFGLLLGKQVDLFSYDMPALNFNFPYKQVLRSPIPVLGIVIIGKVEANIKFKFGYDTYGLTKYANSVNPSARDMLDGFFVDANRNSPAHVQIAPSLEAGPTIDAVVASASVTGGVVGRVNLRLRDNDGDQKVRSFELAANLRNDPLRNLFQTSGGIYAQLKARVDLFGVLGTEKTLVESPPLIQFSGSPGFKTKSAKNPLRGIAKDVRDALVRSGKWGRQVGRKLDSHLGKLAGKASFWRQAKSSPTVVMRSLAKRGVLFSSTVNKLDQKKLLDKGLKVISINNPVKFYKALEQRPKQVVKKLERAVTKPLSKLKKLKW